MLDLYDFERRLGERGYEGKDLVDEADVGGRGMLAEAKGLGDR